MTLNDDERAKLYAQADKIVELLAARYGISPQDVVDAVRWAQEHKEWSGKLKVSAWVGVVGIMISSLLIALWEGIKALLAVKGP